MFLMYFHVFSRVFNSCANSFLWGVGLVLAESYNDPERRGWFRASDSWAFDSLQCYRKTLIFSVHPGKLTWNIIMEVWKTIFLSKWVIYMFHVNLPGCMFIYLHGNPSYPPP